jgi:hypothetical protein
MSKKQVRCSFLRFGCFRMWGELLVGPSSLPGYTRIEAISESLGTRHLGGSGLEEGHRRWKGKKTLRTGMILPLGTVLHVRPDDPAFDLSPDAGGCRASVLVETPLTDIEQLADCGEEE